MLESVHQPWQATLVWIPATAVSLLTTKILLVGEFEKPLSLLLLNVSILTIIQLLGRMSNKSSHPGETNIDSKPTRLGIYSFLAFSICICACLILEYKAIAFTNSLATAILILALDWQPVRLFTQASESRLLGLFRLLALALGFLMIQAWDFRLNKTSRDMSIAFVVLLVAAESISKVSYLEQRFWPNFMRQTNYQISANQWPVWSLVPIGIAAYFEGLSFLWIPSFSTGLLLAVNVTATAAAYYSGGCLPRTLRFFDSDTYMNRTASMLALSGLVSLGCSLIPSLAVINSPWQHVGYFVAIVANISIEDIRQLRGKSKADADIDEEAFEPVRLGSQDEGFPEGTCSPVNHSSRDINEPGRPQKPRFDKKYRSTSILLICALFTWLGFLRANPIATPLEGSTSFNPRLDSDFTPDVDLDIVVARYNRPWERMMSEIDSLLRSEGLQDLLTRVIVYNKGADDMDRDEAAVRPNVEIKSLQNIGREGATYLEHIVSRWDDLARQTLFIQERPHDFGLLRQRVADYLAPETGFMSLSYAGVVTDCAHPHDRSWSQDPRVITSLYRNFKPSSAAQECRDVVLTYRGQFIASGARIRGNDKSLYERMLRELQDPGSWMHSESFTNSPWNRDIRPLDSLNAPVFGYTLERMWGVVMQCSNARVASKNPSLLGAYVHSAWFGRKFPLEDVQCLDGPVIEPSVRR